MPVADETIRLGGLTSQPRDCSIGATPIGIQARLD